MSAEFWVGFLYGVIAVALPVCGAVTWRANRRVQQWLAATKAAAPAAGEWKEPPHA